MLSWMYVYRSISDYLKRLFSFSMTAEGVDDHTRMNKETGWMTDFTSGSVFSSRSQTNTKDIFMGLAFDGFQPFEDDRQYSMWPMVFTPYNFDSRIR